MAITIEQKLQKVLTKVGKNKLVQGAVLAVSQNLANEKMESDFIWQGATGNFFIEDQFFITDATKLYITAIVLQLQMQGKLFIEDSITHYLDWQTLEGLHVYKKVEYSHKIKIRHLMSQTSGLPDFFTGKRSERSTLFKQILQSKDQSWTFEDSIAIAKKMGARFAPATKAKTLYSNTNYQLLAKVIEKITKKSIAEVLHQRIFKPLNLQNTYLYNNAAGQLVTGRKQRWSGSTGITKNHPHNIYYKDKQLIVPKAMASFQGDGGIVSTASEVMIFLQAFFNGKLFPEEFLLDLAKWNKIFHPLKYGIGISLFQLPQIFSPLQPMPRLIGHWGFSGCVAFYCPEKKVFITGTVNQIHQTSIVFKMMNQVLKIF